MCLDDCCGDTVIFWIGLSLQGILVRCHKTIGFIISTNAAFVLVIKQVFANWLREILLHNRRVNSWGIEAPDSTTPTETVNRPANIIVRIVSDSLHRLFDSTEDKVIVLR